MSDLILASASPRRVDLLRNMGVSFEVIPSNAAELHDESISAARVCEINAERKASQVAASHPKHTVLGADTIVTFEGRLFGKPCDRAEAQRMLSELSGRAHQVVTAVCLIRAERKAVFHDVTTVEFKILSPQDISLYLDLVPVLDKAGAYGIQDRGELLVKNVAGSFSNVMGLPTERLALEFDRWKIPYSSRSR